MTRCPRCRNHLIKTLPDGRHFVPNRGVFIAADGTQQILCKGCSEPLPMPQPPRRLGLRRTS